MELMGTLGQVSVTEFGFDSSGYKLATDGQMQFDADDFGTLSSSRLNALVLHEMAHVLGFWNPLDGQRCVRQRKR
ncbi:zinc metalloendopeptidase [Rhodopirellula europaea 6C]|uniref:Zinc metalloendopeptidase n=1 Tax=Rhodopirellula europaea 6C TaxID=1263867 RepID=M2AMD9_9BACT|nr:zinc metalloendopeptidase [Rhodopirellula europaea 6C]